MPNYHTAFVKSCGSVVMTRRIPLICRRVIVPRMLKSCGLRIADAEGRVVITKDDDFVQSFLLRNQPQRLLLIATGNIGNAELSRLIAAALPAMVKAFGTARYIEISHNVMIIHE
jgi:hypothetical protein